MDDRGANCVCGALLGFGLALMLLWDTRLKRTIPVVFAATWPASASSFVLCIPLCPVAIVSFGAILRCERTPPSTARRAS